MIEWRSLLLTRLSLSIRFITFIPTTLSVFLCLLIFIRLINHFLNRICLYKHWHKVIFRSSFNEIKTFIRWENTILTERHDFLHESRIFLFINSRFIFLLLHWRWHSRQLLNILQCFNELSLEFFNSLICLLYLHFWLSRFHLYLFSQHFLFLVQIFYLFLSIWHVIAYELHTSLLGKEINVFFFQQSFDFFINSFLR